MITLETVDPSSTLIPRKPMLFQPYLDQVNSQLLKTGGGANWPTAITSLFQVR